MKGGEAKGLRLILLAFFFPLAIYLLILGFLNRRSSPLLVSGVWDGIGLLFGVSGFLLLAGPAILSALNERWRVFWLLGKNDAPFAAAENASQVWIFLSLLYFFFIVGGAAVYLWRQRQMTAIYNADKEQVEHAVTNVCEQLRIHPTRSNGMFLLDPSPALTLDQRIGSEAITAQRKQMSSDLADRGLEQPVFLEIDSFPLMRHVTLRWQPMDAPVRRTLEAELGRQLADEYSEVSQVGSWLLTLGFMLLSFDLAGTFFLVFLLLFTR